MREMKCFKLGGDRIVCCLTVAMDKCLKNKIVVAPKEFETYIFDDFKTSNKLAIRVPGMTIGCLELNKDKTIKSVKLAKDIYNTSLNPYNENVNEVMNKFIGIKVQYI